MKLSVSMIVKNEEALLGKCLESLKGADEIVILDTGSTDKTGKVAWQYTDKYIAGVYAWNDNFAEARNKSIGYCTGDWIFVIDADEYLEEDGMQKIKERIETTKIRVIGMPSKNERNGDLHYLPRIFKRDPDILFKGAIHNHLSVLAEERLEVPIIYGYSPTHKKDPDRTLRILLKEVAKNSQNPREMYYLAREYWYRKNFITAIWWYKKYLKKSTNYAEISDAWLMLARCYWYLHEGEKARDYCLQAIKFNANFKEAIEFMSQISGPINGKRWAEFAKTANNAGVMFIRKVTGK